MWATSHPGPLVEVRKPPVKLRSRPKTSSVFPGIPGLRSEVDGQVSGGIRWQLVARRRWMRSQSRTGQGDWPKALASSGVGSPPCLKRRQRTWGTLVGWLVSAQKFSPARGGGFTAREEGRPLGGASPGWIRCSQAALVLLRTGLAGCPGPRSRQPNSIERRQLPRCLCRRWWRCPGGVQTRAGGPGAASRAWNLGTSGEVPPLAHGTPGNPSAPRASGTSRAAPPGRSAGGHLPRQHWSNFHHLTCVSRARVASDAGDRVLGCCYYVFTARSNRTFSHGSSPVRTHSISRYPWQ